ncbi:MAG: hypothetical protein P1V51_23045, partial [Deltaproteobacteria bacterium]|nr:hypothetical protein [Deltaproteobacteria bacterium]
GNAVSGSDTGSDTLTIDNQSPGDATWGGVSPANTQITLNWSNPGDGDLAEVMILRNTVAIADQPAEGTTYLQGNTLGTSTIQYVGAGTSTIATGLTNGQDYWFEVFSRDSNGNWAAGVATGPHQPSLVDSDAPCAAADLRVTTQTDTTITIAFVAPYEDCTGTSGNPTAYMVRYGYEAISSGNWADALVFDDAYTPSVAATATETITLTGLDSNTRYYVQVRAVDDFSNVGPVASLLGVDTDKTQSTVHAGWNIGGNENNLGATNTCSGVFGVSSCMYWVSSGVGDWSGAYSDTGPSGQVHDGYGYWLGMAGGENLTPPGDSTPTTNGSTVEVPLQKGMNLLANPHPDAVLLSSLQIVQNPGGGETVNTWENAVLAGWIYSSIYAYDGANYFQETWDSDPILCGKLHPRKGYWLKLAVDDANTYAVRITNPNP